MPIKKVFSYLRFKPFNTRTEQGRTAERYRRAALTSVANVLSAGLSFISFAITVPLTIIYLGQERFGIWMAVASLAGTLSLLDFGISNALVSRIAKLTQSEHPDELAYAITHALFVLTAIGAIAGMALVSAVIFLPIEKLIRVSAPSNLQEVKDAIMLFACIYAASIPLNGVLKIFQGMQLGWRVHITRSAASVVSIIAVYILSMTKANIPALLFATYGIQTLSALGLFFVLIKMRLVNRLNLGVVKNWAETKSLVATGGLFLVLQVTGMIGWGSDALFAAAVIGAAQVAQLAIIQKIFQLVTLPLNIVNGPLWSAYADANSTGDKNFIRVTLQRSLAFSIGYTVISVIAILLLADFLLKFWLGKSVEIENSLILSYGLWTLFEATGGAFAMFLNGVGVVRLQIWLATLFCIIAIPLKFFLPQKLGLEGLIAANIIAYLVAFAVPYALLFRTQLYRYIH